MNSEIELLEYLIKCDNLKNYKEGLLAIEKYEHLIVKKYYEITKYRIIFNLKLDKLIDASIIIKEELSVPYIPSDFEKFLKEKQKEVTYILRSNNKQLITFEDIENIDKVDDEGIMYLIPHLKQFNMLAITDKLQNVFDNIEISPLVKSLLIASLSDYKLDYNFKIIKEDTLIKFNPKTVYDIRTSENFKQIEKNISKINDIEINTLELVTRLSVTYLLYLYPLVITDSYCDEILTAAIYLASKMTNKQIVDSKYDEIYQNRYEKVLKIIEKMNILIESI